MGAALRRIWVEGYAWAGGAGGWLVKTGLVLFISTVCIIIMLQQEMRQHCRNISTMATTTPATQPPEPAPTQSSDQPPKDFEDFVARFRPVRPASAEVADDDEDAREDADWRDLDLYPLLWQPNDWSVVRSTPLERVWTLLDVDGKQVISNMALVVNREAYLITEVAYTGEPCDFYVDEDDAQTFPSRFLSGQAIATLADGSRHLVQECVLHGNHRVEFTPQSRLLPEAVSTVFVMEVDDSVDNPYYSEGSDAVNSMEEVAAFTLPRAYFRQMSAYAQAVPTGRSAHLAGGLGIEPLEHMLNPIVMTMHEDGSPGTNCIAQIASASWAAFTHARHVGSYQAITGCDFVNEFALADLIDAYNGRAAFCGEDWRDRLDQCDQSRFMAFAEVANKVLAAHRSTEAYAQRQATQANPTGDALSYVEQRVGATDQQVRERPQG